MRFLPGLFATILLMLAPSALAEDRQFSFGGDQFAAGQSAAVDTPVARDAFAAGYDVAIRGPVSGDAHLAGFNVSQSADVAGDVYAAGFSVAVSGNVGGDITAMGNSVSVTSPGAVGGNLRLAAQTVTVSAEVAGAALVTAQTLNLSSPVKGDLSFFGETIVFGPNARVDGILTIHAPEQVAVPASVAAPDRVRFEQLVSPDYAAEAGKTAEHVVRSVWPAVWATGLWWLLLFVVGLSFITLAPKLTDALRSAAAARPFRRLGIGLISFAAVVGLVPVLALTIVGVILIPFAVLFVFVACALAYLAGAYLLAIRIAQAMVAVESNLRRIAVLAVAIVVFGLLGMIPVIGWIVTLLILCFGFGAIATITARRLGAAERQPPPGAPETAV